MAGKKRSGLANDKRAYGCGICYPPQTPTPTPTPPTPTPTPPTPIPTPTPTPNTTILEYLADQGTSFNWGTVVFTRDTSLPGFSYTAITNTIPATTVPQSVASISSITIGNTVTSIGANAFFGGTNSSSLTFTPTSTLTSIGANAFQNCFSDPSISTSITIPNSVTSIGASAFRNCDSLLSVTLPTNPLFTSIDTSVFQGCNILTSVTIPNSVTSIGTSAFFGCPDLSPIITIPSSVTSIGTTAFRLCTALTSIILTNSVIGIGTNAFQSSGLSNVTLFTSTQTISGITYTAPSVVSSFFGSGSVNISI